MPSEEIKNMTQENQFWDFSGAEVSDDVLAIRTTGEPQMFQFIHPENTHAIQIEVYPEWCVGWNMELHHVDALTDDENGNDQELQFELKTTSIWKRDDGETKMVEYVEKARMSMMQ
jgi:hypothetical protein